MITSTQLGLNGDLGLNLFRVATTIATANKFSDEYIFPEWNFSANFPELKNKFAIPSTIIPSKIWNENVDLSYNPITNIDKTTTTDLRGVFLDRRYFENASAFLRFALKTTIDEFNYCFIHIIFKQNNNFPTLDLKYYSDALSKMSSIRPDIDTFLIVTDDIVKARTIFIDFREYKFKFTTSTSQIKQLQYMASCSAGILSNTFLSFWGAFLIEDNYIISPNTWFDSNTFHKENINIFNPKWNLLKVSFSSENLNEDITVTEPNSGPPNFKSNTFLFNTSDPIGKKADTYTSENLANKGQPNGYVPLNAYRKIPYIYLDLVTINSPGILSSLDKIKLDGIEPLATKNSTDAQLRDRTTHTGQQPISTITDLQSNLDVKIANSFETVTTNLRSYPVIDSTFVPGVSLSKTYSTPGGNIVITTNFSGGKPSTKVLSGVGLPSGIATTKTYDFTGRTVPLVSYT